MNKLFVRYKILIIALAILQCIPLRAWSLSSVPTVVVRNTDSSQVSEEITQALVNRLKQQGIETQYELAAAEKSQSTAKDNNAAKVITHAMDLVEKGRRAFTLQHKTKEAIKTLESAHEYIMNKMPVSRERSSLISEILMIQAWVYYKSNNVGKAKEMIAFVKSWNPNEDVGFPGVPPSINQLILATPPQIRNNVGTIQITTPKRREDVFVDGYFVGASPIQMQVEAGEHDVVVKSEKAYRNSISVKEGKNHKIVANITEKNRPSQMESQESEAWFHLGHEDKVVQASALIKKYSAQYAIYLSFDPQNKNIQPILSIFDANKKVFLSAIAYNRVSNLQKASADIVNFFTQQILAEVHHQTSENNQVATEKSLNKSAKKHGRKKTGLWIAVGSAVLGGIIGGVVLATQSGGNSNQQGSLSIGLEGI